MMKCLIIFKFFVQKLLRADLTLEEQRDWEAQEMARPVDFAAIRIDPAPFQLVEKTSILKVKFVLS
jgi:chloride channel 2